MFGLMRARKCGMTAEEKHFRRLHYCGTCKTIGSLYGQKSRLLLNHDIVFLAEILTALSGENINDWQTAYQSFNCLNLPKKEMPLALRFAATANVILTEFKIADHINDEQKRRFKLAHRIFSREFLEAEKLLKVWNFPLDKVREILESQERREAKKSDLDVLAEPTAQTTALFFSEGAKLIGKPEVENTATNIGFQFGKLIYLLDAFEDYKKDFEAEKFNAIRSVYNLNEEAKLPAETKRKVASILYQIEREIISEIYKLPISESQKIIFAARLEQNLQKKLQISLPVVQLKKTCTKKSKQTLRERWRQSVETARKMAQSFSWQMPLVFLFVLLFTFAAPAQTREAKSARECFDLGFNLMFIGAIVGSVLATPSMIMQQMSPGKFGKKSKKNQEENGGWCDNCDCCDCNCDGCCDCDCCCDCDGCDGCNCGDGCCDGCCDCSCDC